MSERIACIIANQNYHSPRLPNLDISEPRIATMASTLLDPEIGNFDVVEYHLDVDSADLRRLIIELFQYRKPYDLLLLYFIGYTIVDEAGELFLASVDVSLKELTATATATSEIGRQLDKSFSRRQILVLDTTFVSNTVREADYKSDLVFTLESVFKGQGYWRTLLSTNASTEYTTTDLEHGDALPGQAFTEYFFRGLQTGDADFNGDGLISIVELHQYLTGKLKQANLNTVPHLFTWREQEEFIIARTAPGNRRAKRPKWDLIMGATTITIAIFMLGWQADKVVSIQASVAFIIFYAVLYRFGD